MSTQNPKTSLTRVRHTPSRRDTFAEVQRQTSHSREGKPIRDGAKHAALARALSKLGFCSRNEAWKLIHAGRVRVNGAVCRDAEQRVSLDRDRLDVDGRSIEAGRKIHLMLNKPRGLVTTASDEKGRGTVFDCLKNAGHSGESHLFAVGRLDKASEGLLLFTNDTAWAARITDPASRIEKTYHVQIDCVADDALLRRLTEGVREEGELLAAHRASLLRSGGKNSWLEIVLDEGRNRHIRRMLAALGINVLRLVRVSVGPLLLGSLAKGAVRELTAQEVDALAR